MTARHGQTKGRGKPRLFHAGKAVFAVNPPLILPLQAVIPSKPDMA